MWMQQQPRLAVKFIDAKILETGIKEKQQELPFSNAVKNASNPTSLSFDSDKF